MNLNLSRILLVATVTSTVHGFSILRQPSLRRRTSVALSASTAATSATSRLKRISKLNEWAKDSGIQLGGVGIESSSGDGAGLGLAATQTVKSGSVVVAVPSKVALSVESPGDGPDDANVSRDLDRRAFRGLPWFVQFSAYLYRLDQVSSKRGDALDMQPWLDSLPRVFDTPIHWTKEARDELQYQHLLDAVSRQETEWKGLYDRLVATGLSGMTYSDFCWGCECARSRAFSGGFTGSAFNPLVYAFTLLLVTAYVGLNLGTLEQAANGAALVVCASILNDFVVPKLFKKKKYVICPIIDMANHRSIGTSGDVSFEFFGDAYSLAMERDVTKDSEVYISYGARSNDQLLQFYGFVESDNPHDVYVMPPLREWDIGALEKACGRTFNSGRLEKLDRAGLLGNVAPLTSDAEESAEGAANPLGGVVVTRAGGLDPAVMQALRALVSSDEEWQASGEAIGNFAAENSGGAENERMARVAAKTAIELELASKATTLEQDEELLKRLTASKSGDSVSERIAIVFRIEKKKLLAEVLSTL